MNSTLPPVNPTELGQVAITVTDLPRAAAFYREVIGLKHLFDAPPGLSFFACGSVRFMLALPEKPDAERFAAALYFKVEDLEKTCGALEDRGVALMAKPHRIARLPDHELWMAFLRDPDQNLIGLMCEKKIAPA